MSQIGYMLMSLGLFTVAGVAGAIIFVVHQIPVKTVLFLTGGLVESEHRTSTIGRVGGLIATRPWVAALFALPALSLAGLPPFSGFVAKLALVDAGVADGQALIVVVALVGSALTLLSMVKIWMGIFWGAPAEESPAPTPELTTRGSWPTMVGATAAMAAVTLAIAVAAGPLWNMSERAATELLDGEPYVSSVLSPGDGVAADGGEVEP